MDRFTESLLRVSPPYGWIPPDNITLVVLTSDGPRICATWLMQHAPVSKHMAEGPPNVNWIRSRSPRAIVPYHTRPNLTLFAQCISLTMSWTPASHQCSGRSHRHSVSSTGRARQPRFQLSPNKTWLTFESGKNCSPEANGR